MVLDGRMYEVTSEDWQLAGVLMAESNRVRQRIATIIAESSRKANRAKAHAAAERDEVLAEKKVQRAANGIVARLERAGRVMSQSELRKALRSDLRPEFQPAVDALIAAEVIDTTPHGYTLTGGQVDTAVHPHNTSSEGVDTVVHVDTPCVSPPGEMQLDGTYSAPRGLRRPSSRGDGQ